MAAVITDFISDSSHFHHSHTMVGGSAQQRSQAESPYQQQSTSRTRHHTSPHSQHTQVPVGTSPPTTNTWTVPQVSPDDVSEKNTSVKDGPPSPPSSSSPKSAPHSSQHFTGQNHAPEPSVQYGRSPKPKLEPSDEKVLLNSPPGVTRAARSLDDMKNYGANVIKVRDLAHIQSFATDDFVSYNRGVSGKRQTTEDQTLKYEISGMPITDIIEMVAGLLTKITTTNDRQHENLHRPIISGDSAANMDGLSSSVLAFHGKNVPSITILSYLSRIHKYCPTTYEVFLSLLVYFDRMTERVNASPLQALRRESVDQGDSRPSSSYSAEGSDLADSPPPSRSVPESAEDLQKAQYPPPSAPEPNSSTLPLSHFFVVDSFNIHRLVIAGVTCASKFFSDVFYTNSRYAKVGGLPLAELNHLELQFLLLNDFRLSVPVEELEAYGTMLVEFYAREVIAQRHAKVANDVAHDDDDDARASGSP